MSSTSSFSKPSSSFQSFLFNPVARSTCTDPLRVMHLFQRFPLGFLAIYPMVHVIRGGPDRLGLHWCCARPQTSAAQDDVVPHVEQDVHASKRANVDRSKPMALAGTCLGTVARTRAPTDAPRRRKDAMVRACKAATTHAKQWTNGLADRSMHAVDLFGRFVSDVDQVDDIADRTWRWRWPEWAVER